MAPMITPIDSTKVRRPTFTKETTRTVVADDDCTKLVVKRPVRTPLKRLPVAEANAARMRAPANFWIPSDMTFMPKRKTPRAPRMVNAVVICRSEKWNSLIGPVWEQSLD